MKNQIYSTERIRYLKKIQRDNVLVHALRIGLLTLALIFWELLATVGVIDSFITSCPSKIAKTIVKLFTEAKKTGKWKK